MTSEITTTNLEGNSSIYQSTESFEFAQRQAKSLCESDLVPTSYQGQKGLSNCLVALEMSKRMNPKMVPDQKMTKRKMTKRKKQSKVWKHSACINEDKYFEPK